MSNPGRRSQIMPEAQNIPQNCLLNGNIQNIQPDPAGNTERSVLERTTSLLLVQYNILKSDWSDNLQSRKEGSHVTQNATKDQSKNRFRNPSKKSDYKIVQSQSDSKNSSLMPPLRVSKKYNEAGSPSQSDMFSTAVTSMYPSPMHESREVADLAIPDFPQEG